MTKQLQSVYVQVDNPQTLSAIAHSTPYEPVQVNANECVLTYEVRASEVDGLIEAIAALGLGFSPVMGS